MKTAAEKWLRYVKKKKKGVFCSISIGLNFLTDVSQWQKEKWKQIFNTHSQAQGKAKENGTDQESPFTFTAFFLPSKLNYCGMYKQTIMLNIC